MRPILSCTLTLLALVLVVPPARADGEETQADEEAVRGAGLETEGPALVDFFRKRTPGEKVRQNIETLVRALGSKSFRIRQNACKELVVLGPPALRLLREAASGSDLESARRAQRCIEEIERSLQPDLIAAAARLLAQRRPPHSVDVLLAYLPFAPDENVSDEVRGAIARAGFLKGKPDDALLRALEDQQAVRRSAAAEALALHGAEKEKKRAKALLKDADAGVRLRVALALIEAKDNEAVGALIVGLAEVPAEQRWRVEQLLPLLAGEQAPAVGVGATELEWKRYCREWSGWWREHGTKGDLAKLDLTRRMLGLTLIVQLDPRRMARQLGGRVGIAIPGRVFEVGMDGKTRWEITDLNYPTDAQVIGPNRVLITEYRGRQISERNFKGDVLWRKEFSTYVFSARRLANGHTLVNLRNQLVELDRSGREVFSYTSRSGIIMSAGKMRNGQTVVVEHSGECIHLDERGRAVKTISVGMSGLWTIGSHADILPNGNVVIPDYSRNKVVEYDASGRKVWEVSANRPTGVMRLPNGNTLVTSRLSRGVEEFDRGGRSVWQYQSDNTGSNLTLYARRR
jgi:hypothetical protein